MNIYVSNLAITTTTHDLRQLFEPYGVVDTVRIITDRDTGRCKGFGFVEMSGQSGSPGRDCRAPGPGSRGPCAHGQ